MHCSYNNARLCTSMLRKALISRGTPAYCMSFITKFLWIIGCSSQVYKFLITVKWNGRYSQRVQTTHGTKCLQYPFVLISDLIVLVHYTICMPPS